MNSSKEDKEEIITLDSLVGKIKGDLSFKGFSRLAKLYVNTEKPRGVSISGEINKIPFNFSLPFFRESKYLGSYQRIISDFQDGVMTSIGNCDSHYDSPFNLIFFPESKGFR